MTKTLIAAAAALSFIGVGAAQAGCLGGAVVGGVAGHVAGHHATLGAIGGCAVGHHLAVKKKRERQMARAQARDMRHH